MKAFITMNPTFLQKRMTDLRRQYEDLSVQRAEQEIRKASHKEKERTMRDQPRPFEPFLKLADGKRCRAVQKAKEERKKINELERKRCALADELKALRQKKAKLDRDVQQYALFEAYVKKVAQSRKQEPGELMHCFATLMHSENILWQIAQNNLDCAQHARAQYAFDHQQATDVILHRNNELGQLLSELDKAQANRMIMDSQWSHILDTAAKKTLQLGTIKMATLNLSQIVDKNKSGGPPVDQEEDTMKQLEQVRTFLTHSFDVLLEVKKNQELQEPQPGKNEKKVNATV